jgi:hypothetical protein
MRSLLSLAGLAIMCSGCVAVAPDAPVVTQTTVSVSPSDPACRDYTAQALVDGRPQVLVGHACQQADGSWRIIEGTPDQPQQFVGVYPEAYADDSWFWGPPIGLSVGGFVFVDRTHHFHDFTRFHHRFVGGFRRDGFGHAGFPHGFSGMRAGRIGRG